MASVPTRTPRTVDDYVAIFEAALPRQGSANLPDFLPPADHPLYRNVLAELIRVELEHDWENGLPRSLEYYRGLFPHAFADRSLLRDIAFEEYRLRRQAGQDPDPEEYAGTLGIETTNWPPRQGRPLSRTVNIRAVTPAEAQPAREESLLDAARSYQNLRKDAGNESLDLASWMRAAPGGVSAARLFHDLHRADPRAARRLADGLAGLPHAGETLFGFHLIEELGHGAFGRVFLARQEALAGRPVALKVAADVGGESQTLAQLQHTHIVPIYSVHRTGGVQAVCMPYFGSVTLSDVLGDLIRRPSLPLAGSDLLSRLTLRRGQPPASGVSNDPGSARPGPLLTPLAAPALKFLEGLSYVEAVVWVGCCLADGLAHAHERGILHRDLKPANVLLTDEGQPMLLDFNLAADTKLRGSAPAAVVGGTIPYMAPEQLAAFRGDAVVVDQRADVFALGIILYELLTGQSPFPPLDRQGHGDDVDVLVAAVYQSRLSPPVPVRLRNRSVTPAVWSILRRCLEADPARRYASARQLHEDLQRQLDHRPLKHAPDPSLRERLSKQLRRSPRAVACVVALVALVLALAAGGVALYAHQEKKAEQTRAERLHLEQQAGAAYTDSLAQIHNIQFLLTTDEGAARRAEGVRAARRLIDDLGIFSGDDWRDRPLIAYLAGPERRTFENAVGELLLLLARNVAPSEALPMVDEAAACFAPDVPPPVWLQKAGLLEQQGEREASAELMKQVLAQPPRTARDHYLLARPLLAARKYPEARPLLLKAASLDPQSLMARFLLAVCHDGLNNDKDAIACYDVCLALVPDFHGGCFNRGLAHLRRGQYALARDDFDRAIELRPESADAHYHRALARQRVGQLKEAAADFTRAFELDPTQTHILFSRSQVRSLLGDKPGADADLAEGLRRDPRDEKSWNARGHAHLQRNETEAALECFNRGLEVNPEYRPNLTSKAYVLADRLGRNRDALEVSNQVVRLHPAYVYGYSDRGVLLARLDRRDDALKDARHALTLSAGRDDEPELLYRVACIYALTSRTAPTDANFALRLLHDALRRGFGAEHLPDDADLKPLHGQPEFPRLRELARSLRTSPI